MISGLKPISARKFWEEPAELRLVPISIVKNVVFQQDSNTVREQLHANLKQSHFWWLFIRF